MRIYDVIKDKRDGKALTKEQIDFWIKGVVDKSVEDYQSAALLMAIVLNSMTDEETFYLTDAMAKSGETLDLSQFGDASVDKHSSGGVGDSTSFVVIPVMAALGRICAKMSGRGLGHTGGTIDKLESIKGVSTDLDEKRFFAQLKDIGLAIAGQTKNVCPADKILYALRDVTATVDSIPLIASSIMSKKLAAGAHNIVLDVKCGEGAFMKDRKSAVKLARLMVEIGKRAGRNVSALITAMDEPLSDYIGNALEVAGAAEVLKGRKDCELYTVSKALCERLLGYEGCAEDIDRVIESGEAYDKFVQLIKAQGGNTQDLDSQLFGAKYKMQVKAKQSGYVAGINAIAVANAVLLAGGGRNKKGDEILPYAGVKLLARRGAKVAEGDVIAEFYYEREQDKCLSEQIERAFSFCKSKPRKKQTVLCTVE